MRGVGSSAGEYNVRQARDRPTHEEVLRVTIDTNLLEQKGVADTAARLGFDSCIVSATRRETEGSSLESTAASHETIPEVAVWGETRWDEGSWGDEGSGACFERALVIISGGAFPRPECRAQLTRGQKRQLRDAMIFCSHVRDNRDIFISDDRKGFVNDGRRATLETEFKTRILTSGEFLAEFSA